MKIKLGNRYINNKVIITSILILFFSILSIPTIIATADAQNTIKILEIEPGNSFILGNNLEKNLIGECSIQGINFKKVKVTHVTMSQFISQVDQINGKYDIVVIGRSNNSLNSPYRDYSNPFSEQAKKSDGEPGYIPETWNSSNKILNGEPIGETQYVEYMSENDITKKRAIEVLSLIDSGQLVYIDDDIIDSNSGLKDTNLFKEFNGKSYKSLNKNQSNLLSKIVSDYIGLEINNKSPKISLSASYEDVDDTDEREINFNVNIIDNVKSGDQLKVNLYIDKNNDTIFTQNEEVTIKNSQRNIVVGDSAANNHKVTYLIPKNFFGYLQWKLELVRTLPDGKEIKSYVVGNKVIEKLSNQEEKNIKILQITSPPGNQKARFNEANDLNNNISLKNNIEFNEFLNESGMSGYNIKIDEQTIDEFEKNVADNKKGYLNGRYSMIIIGFADSYGLNKLGNHDFSNDALNEIENFIKTGQSVIFTHDTMPIVVKSDVEVNVGTKKLARRFRDIIGQSRYVDENNKTQKDLYRNSVITKDSNEIITNIEYEDKFIPHDSIPSGDFEKNTYGYADGILIQAANSGDDENKTKQPYISTSNKILKLNEGMINSYPFEINNEDEDDNYVDVSTTHSQWFQLNLEDPDIVPWYTIDAETKIGDDSWKNKYLNKYDSRNNFYAYSKGNITYSGMGNRSNFPESELKLFINTIVKADMGSNHAPNIICSIRKDNTNNSVNEVSVNEMYSFNIDANDENDIVKMHITIDGEELTSDNVDLNNLETTNNKKQFVVNTSDYERKKLEVKIPKSKFSNINSNIIIKIEAEDIQGAKTEKSYILNVIEGPNFIINTDLSKLSTVDEQDQDIYTSENPNSIIINKSDRVKAEYILKPQPLQYGKLGYSNQKEMAILIDLSMTDDHQQFTNSKNGIRNSIVGKFLSSDIVNQRDDVKFDIITYGNDVKEELVDSNAKDQNGYLLNYRDQLEQKLNAIYSDNSTSRKLGGAIEKAVDFFDRNNQENSSKNIIIITAGEPTDTISDIYWKKIKSSNYNIVTLSMDESAEAGNLYPILYNWHLQMGGFKNDYYISKPDNASTQEWSHNNIDRVIIPKISDSLSSFKYKTYIISEVKLNFNLGSDIDLDKGLVDNPNSSNPKEYISNMPRIRYIAKEEEDENKNKILVYYGYFLNDNALDDNEFDSNIDLNEKITTYKTDFIIKPNQISNIKERVFSDYNLVTYKDNINIVRSFELITPKLIINAAKVDHGVYKGIIEGKAYIDTNKLYFPADAVVTFASNIAKLNRTVNLELNITNSQINTIPQLYKINQLNQLERLKDSTGNYFVFSKVDDTNYRLSNFPGDDYNNIIVIYSIKLKKIDNLVADKKYINTIIVDDNSVKAIVYPLKDDLPDLF